MSIDSLNSRLRHRVTLQQASLAADGAGGGARTWADVADLWAEIVPYTPRASASQSAEVVVDGHQQSNIMHKVTLRYRTDLAVTPDMRLLYGDRILLIRQILNLNERGMALQILAEEGPRMG